MAQVYRIRIAPRAADDLRGIFDWIQNNSPENAQRMIKRLLDVLMDWIFCLTDIPFRNLPKEAHGKFERCRFGPIWCVIELKNGTWPCISCASDMGRGRARNAALSSQVLRGFFRPQALPT
jgi:hypothetical protein